MKFRLNKKGVSEIVTYVLIIIIVMGISAMVYVYLEVLVPKKQAVCDQDVSLVLRSVSCTYYPLDSNKLVIETTLENKGFHNIDAAYLRFGEKGRKVKESLSGLEPYIKDGGLKPRTTKTIKYQLSDFKFDALKKYEIDLEPAITTDKGLAVCEDSRLIKEVTCELFNTAPNLISISSTTSGPIEIFGLETSLNPVNLKAEVNDPDNEYLNVNSISKVEFYLSIDGGPNLNLGEGVLDEEISNLDTAYYNFEYTPERVPKTLFGNLLYTYSAKVTDDKLFEAISSNPYTISYLFLRPPLISLSSPSLSVFGEGSKIIFKTIKIEGIPALKETEYYYIEQGLTEPTLIGKGDSTNAEFLFVSQLPLGTYELYSQTKDEYDQISKSEKLEDFLIVPASEFPSEDISISLTFSKELESTDSIEINSLDDSGGLKETLTTCTDPSDLCQAIIKPGDHIVLKVIPEGTSPSEETIELCDLINNECDLGRLYYSESNLGTITFPKS
ncbi:hypothetical protein COU54_01980 [Candidatus Pacearchaeota archaeon CG10_big_fil_rev_8_21_14_0_10_31_24]|nr:MAG: hypothetical protein COU54_01980 [Candidatus Pacearchaeota archaeon CG10_big_fil_rev_8_21_14_0_10_31_24]